LISLITRKQSASASRILFVQNEKGVIIGTPYAWRYIIQRTGSTTRCRNLRCQNMYAE
jgi:hypothetical protein